MIPRGLEAGSTDNASKAYSLLSLTRSHHNRWSEPRLCRDTAVSSDVVMSLLKGEPLVCAVL